MNRAFKVLFLMGPLIGCRTASTGPTGMRLEVFTDSVLCYIKYCINTVTVDKQIRVYSNQKSWTGPADSGTLLSGQMTRPSTVQRGPTQREASKGPS